MQFTIPIYQVKKSGHLYWTTLGIGPHTVAKDGRSPLKIQQGIVAILKKSIADVPPDALLPLQMTRGIRLARAHLELTLRGTKKRKVAGTYPLIIEAHWITQEDRLKIAYHPHRQEEWFPLKEDLPLEEQATIFFSRTWANLDDHLLDALPTNRKDQLKTIAFIAEPQSLFEQLPERQRGVWDDLEVDLVKTDKPRKRRKGMEVLPKIATNQTMRAIEESLGMGTPRAPYRAQLQMLLCGEKKRSVVVVGDPGCGKTTIINRFIRDLVEADDYPVHQNLDRIHQVWELSGKRIIAGMSYVGDWEKRCTEIVNDVRGRRILLSVDDLHAFGRIGQSQQSSRNLAEFFRGPVSRGEMVIIGECTKEQLQRLEDDAPSFAALFTRVHVNPTTAEETIQIMYHEARRLELEHQVAFAAAAFRTILELGGSLFSSSAFPGKAVDQLRELAKAAADRPEEERTRLNARERSSEGAESARVRPSVGPNEVIEALSVRTGLPELLLQPSTKLLFEQVYAAFEQQVMGQEEAVSAVVDLILTIRAGLTDPKRPYGVFLFTGPTGTGKTELAKCLAEYLYSGASRLLRFDMSELNGPDAPIRLIGDRLQPEGLLTRAIQEQPFSVVLLDEIEKADPSVLNLLLQLFDEGRLTDAAGNTADFCHAVVIMTSNLGARARPALGFGEQPDALVHDIAQSVRDFFPPELFNRIDRVVRFFPLSHDVALQIAEKELSRLVGRRGLTERSIFVYAQPDVLQTIVREAFDTALGARPVKRYLQDQIGTLLTEQITRARDASMQIYNIFSARDGGFRLYAETLREADPIDAEYALTPFLSETTRSLMEHLPRAVEAVRSVLRSRALERLSDRIQQNLNLGGEHVEKVYHLDALRVRLRELEDWLETVGYARKEDPELTEAEYFPREPDRDRGAGQRTRKVFDPRMMRPTVPGFTKARLLDIVAEAFFLKRAFHLVEQPDQHTVFIEIMRVGQARFSGRFHPGHMGLLETLAQVYCDQAEAEEYAMHLPGGQVLSGEQRPPLEKGPDHVVLKRSGLCLYEQLRDEEGCHIWQSLTHGTELVRVRVFPATGQSARDVLADHFAARKRFQEAISTASERSEHAASAASEVNRLDRRSSHSAENSAFDGARILGIDPNRSITAFASPSYVRFDETLVPNPERLLPAIRYLAFEPPERPNETALIEVEDYTLSYAAQTQVRSLKDALRPLWLLRMSRVLQAERAASEASEDGWGGFADPGPEGLEDPS